MPDYSIGEVAERSGLSRSTLRYYESVGVIRSPVRRGGRRVYSEGVFLELALLEAAKRASFTLAEIHELRAHEERGMTLAEAWARVAPSKRRAARELEARARSIRSTLAAARQCECVSLQDCSLLARLGA